MALNHPPKQIKRASAGSRNSLETDCTCEFRPQAVKEVYGIPHRAVVKRSVASRFDHTSPCGFATRGEETRQQGESTYGKIQLLSDRPRQKRVSTKPVNPSGGSTWTEPPFLHLSNAPLTRRLTPASDYGILRWEKRRATLLGPMGKGPG